MKTISNAENNSSDRYAYLKPRFIPNTLVAALIFITFLVAIYSGFMSGQLPDFAAWTATLLLLLSFIICVAVTPRNFCVGFLISLLPFMLAWRVAAMNGAFTLMVISTIAFIVILVQFFDSMRNDWLHDTRDGWLGNVVWQSTLVRIVFGLNELGHTSEKIWAGETSYHHLVSVFSSLGAVHFTAAFVILAGLFELAMAIGLTFGFLTRLSGFVGVVYLLVATLFFGHEWVHGYAWNAGGWEYVVLVLTVFFSVMFSGAGKFSIDGWLISRGRMPKALLPLCVTKSGRL